MTMNDQGKAQRSVFAKYIASPERCEPETAPPANFRSLPVGRFLHWLTHWNEPTISARQIYTYGPRCIRDWKEAVGVAEVLAQRGWLVPLPAHRIDRKVWLVVRGAEQMGAPRASQTAELPPNC
jgi:hypothetical protein